MTLKRLALCLLAASITACGSHGSATTSPSQTLQDALKAMGGLKAARADYVRDYWQHYPPGYPFQQLPGMPVGTISVRLSGAGEVQFPDRYHYTITIVEGAEAKPTPAPTASVVVQLIWIHGAAYRTNPVQGHLEFGAAALPLWVKSKSPGNLMPVNPFTTLDELRHASATRDLGDAILNGISVHHYAMQEDKSVLLSQETTLVSDPKFQTAIQDKINSEDREIEVWIGVDDGLLHRISERWSLKETVGLLQAEVKGQPLPDLVAEMTEIRGGFVLNFHDFNRPVNITAPSLS
jgi:hypothetical protein